MKLSQKPKQANNTDRGRTNLPGQNPQQNDAVDHDLYHDENRTNPLSDIDQRPTPFSQNGPVGTRTQTVAKMAYSLWEKEGRPEGKDQEYWFRAEQELSDRPQIRILG